MLNERKVLARQATRAGIELRQRLGVSTTSPICAVDCASRLGLDVWYTGGSSFSGMYDNASKTILVPALRPIGYQALTCAHELGHWHFKHGTRVDEYGDFDEVTNSDPEEQIAILFAASFLMPKRAVAKAFGDRLWHPGSSSDVEVYTIATLLGVGYTALVKHMQWSLHLISAYKANELCKSSPKKIRQQLLGDNDSKHLAIVDCSWAGVSVDLSVGDAAIFPASVIIESNCLEIKRVNQTEVVVIAQAPGVTRVTTTDGSLAVYVRVSRKEYKGHSENRHSEDPDFNEHSCTNSGNESIESLGKAAG